MVLITIVTGAYKPTYNWVVDEPSDGQKRWLFINDENSLAKSREILTSRLSGFHVLSFYLEYGTSPDPFCAA